MTDFISDLYHWKKDRHFRYIECSEGYARAAGLDGPKSIVGLSDDDMPWRSLADEFREGDQAVLDGLQLGRGPVRETEIMVDRVADILVTEIALLDTRGRRVGVHGNFIDITGHEIVRRCGSLSHKRKRFCLGPEFSNVELTYPELRVLREILSGWDCPAIAARVNRSKRTVEDTIGILRRKLVCETKDEIVRVALDTGLVWIVKDVHILKV